MKIQAWLFITFWAVISITFLHLGFRALDETELSYSVHPAVMFLFKHSLAVSSCFSSSYALKFRAQPQHEVRTNFILFVYVFLSFVFPRTIEGKLIWHLLRIFFSWLLYFLLKLKMFLGMILRFPASALGYFFRFLRKILPVMGVTIICLVLYYIPPSVILFNIFSVAGSAVGIFFILLFEYMYAYAFSWLFSKMEFIRIPFPTFLGTCSIVLFTAYCLRMLCFLVYKLILACKKNFSELKTRAGILLVIEISLFFVSVKKENFSPVLVLSISHLVSVCWASVSRFGYTPVSTTDPLWEGEGLVDIGIKFVILKMKEVLWSLNEHKAKKLIEFAVGTVSAILFQNFFRITSFREVAAFLYFTVMWLANLVLMGFCGDFGVFNFLLANVVVGCTVGQFGLHSATWLALGASLLLFALRLKLESVAMAYEEAQRIQISFFGEDSTAGFVENIDVVADRTSDVVEDIKKEILADQEKVVEAVTLVELEE